MSKQKSCCKKVKEFRQKCFYFNFHFDFVIGDRAFESLGNGGPSPSSVAGADISGRTICFKFCKKKLRLILGKISSQLVTTFNKWKLFYSWKCSPELWSPHVDECSTEAEISLNLLLNKIQSNITFCKDKVHLGLSLNAW